jgi:WD40 repeat protein
MTKNFRGIGFQQDKPPVERTNKTKLLVFAINEYSNNRYWDNLVFPRKYTEKFVEILQTRYGVREEDILGEIYDAHATYDRVVTEIEQLEYTDEFGSLKVGKDDNLIIFFSGHGYFSDGINGEIGYWVMHDSGIPELVVNPSSKQTQDKNLFTVDQLVDHISKTVCRHMLIIIDCCYSTYFATREVDLPDLIIPQEGRKGTQNPSRWILTSGRGERVPDKSEFARKLNELLSENKNSKIGIEEIHVKLKTHLERIGLPIPYCHDLVRQKWKGGDFSFLLAPDTVQREIQNRGLDKDFRSLLKIRSRSHFRLLTEEGRYRHLRIEKSLLATPDIPELLGINVRTENQLSPLYEAIAVLWRKYLPHGIIIGEGGMGKTVSLLEVWRQLLSEPSYPIPLFIPLNEFNRSVGIKKKTFILRYIAATYLDESDPTDAFLEKLWSLFIEERQSSPPDFILLLDGYNEVSVDEESLLSELGRFSDNTKNVQLLVTSRYSEIQSNHWARNATLFNLQPLSDSSILSYLGKFQSVTIPSGEILTLLKNPMMLSLYIGTDITLQELKEKDKQFVFDPATKKGELLWNFNEAMLAKQLGDRDDDEVEKDFVRYLFRLLIPYLAWKIEKSGEFYLQDSPNDSESLTFSLVINEACAYFDTNSEACAHAFPEFFHSKHLPIGHKEGLENMHRSRKIRKYLLDILQVMVLENNSSRFLHQHFRDFFSACHLRNSILIGLNNGIIPVEWSERKIPWEVREMIGDIEGEYLKATSNPAVDKFNKRGHLAKLLNMCRGKELRHDYILWNTIHIMAETQGDLTGLNLENLDLRGIPFNGMKFYRQIGNHRMIANLKNSRINGDQFFQSSHLGNINSVMYNSDGTKILTASDDGTIKEWDTSRSLVTTYMGHLGSVKMAVYSSSGDLFLSLSHHLTIKIWKVGQEFPIQIIKNSQIFQPTPFLSKLLGGKKIVKNSSLERSELRVTYAIFSTDENYLILGCNDWLIRIWDIREGKVVKTLEGHWDYITHLIIPPHDKKMLVSCSNDSRIIRWNQSTWHKEDDLSTFIREDGHHGGIINLSQGSSGTTLLTSSLDGYIKIWDTSSRVCRRTYWFNEESGQSVFTAYAYQERRILAVYEYGLVCEYAESTAVPLKYLQLPKARIAFCDYSDIQKKLLVVFEDMDIAEILIDKDFMVNSFSVAISPGINSIANNPEKNTILVASNNSTVKEFSVDSGVCINVIETRSIPEIISFSQTKDCFLISTAAHTIEEYGRESGEFKRTSVKHFKKINSATYSPDGYRILTASEDGRVIEYMENEKVLFKNYAAKSANYDRKGQRIIIAPDDLSIREIRLDSTHEIGYLLTNAIIYKYPELALYLPLNPNRILVKFLSESRFEREDKFYTYCTHGSWLRQFNGHLGSINSFDFSPCGNFVLTASEDQTVREWELTSGKCVNTLRENDEPVVHALYSSDGTLIFSALRGGLLRFWSRKSKKYVREIYNEPGLFTQGLDLRHLHPDSRFTVEQQERLQQHGAAFTGYDREIFEKTWIASNNVISKNA